jgi:small-conductance mechanosensitive channel
MSFWTNIQQTLIQLVDDRQDFWQWSALILCLFGASSASFLLRTKAFRKGSPSLAIITRFFNPAKQISLIPASFCILLWITWSARIQWSKQLTVQGGQPIPSDYIFTTALLISALVIYQVATAVSKGRSAPKFLGGLMLIIFALQVFGWLEPLSLALQGIRLPIGNIEINVWAIISAVAALFILLWLVGLSVRFIDSVLKPRTDIPPSIKVLIGKGSRLTLYIIAIVGALKIGGVPLGGLAVFSGALGLGLGFGLQKVISNLVAGVIMLLDKSIKPGDVIEIEGTFGWINSLRSRYISVITRDRKEILIPNEDFITNKVINWSFTDRVVRIKADVGVSYATDIPEAIRICKEATKDIPRVLADPGPNCLLKEFGDSSINLQIRFWIDDAPQGVSNVRSEVLIAVWKAFRENNIEIPFPQRDIHIKSDHFLPVTSDHHKE